ncbi:MAG: nicotinate-nucleotide--dimethylbenzimidazole phosphoribosyltransferase [Clostridia bacterium]|nr:nicotinate-nucleotide--dimethylbenzimidazole phosphoribosyltransferase [Clostridia bacterium]
MTLLEKTIAAIQPLDAAGMEAAKGRISSLAKPRGSLGVLEDIAVKLAGIHGKIPYIGGKVVIIIAGDHGVAEEGVSAYPQDFTIKMVDTFLKGGAAVNVLARHAGAEIVVVDMGVKGSLGNHASLRHSKIKFGTDNMLFKPAMTREEAVRAVECGIEAAREEMEKGAGILALGEMGIGNTTPSTAILASLAGVPVEGVVGRGTGIDGEILEGKCRIINTAIEKHSPDPRDPLDVLAKVGGLEIAGLVGVILGSAAKRTPVIMDGFISGAAAMLAAALRPECRDYIFPSHLSMEPGHGVMLDWLGLKPIIHMDMCLGEGTGAVLALHIIEAAVKIFNEMATLDELSTCKDPGC